jgi:murein L,D-transpeptidase YafK
MPHLMDNHCETWGPTPPGGVELLNFHPLARALLAPAVIVAALALSGCYQDEVTSGRALAPLSDKMLKDIADKNMDKESPILVRLFKEEAELEVWKQTRDGEFALLKTYPICRWSGDLGPKKKEGDRQAPEGFYTITPGQMNPNSNYYLAFNTGFPNAYDRAHSYTGSELMVHGDCSSRGCYAMTDEQIQEIYALARESFFGGQKEFQFQAFPFRMTALNMAKHRNNPNFAFWKMIKEGYDDFEATHQEPKVAVCERRYVFDAAPPNGSTKPLKFEPRGKCPAYQLDKNVATAVLDMRRSEQLKMANYISENVSLAPPHIGDGGMNPVFADMGSGAQAPRALPHVPNPPGAYAALHPPKNPKPAPTSTAVASAAPDAAAPDSEQPVTLASVPVPPAAPLPKEGVTRPEQPTTMAGLFGQLFGNPQPQQPEAQSQPAVQTAEAVPEPESAPVALRGTQASANSKPAPVIPTAAASAKSHAKPHPAQPKAIAARVPERKSAEPAVKQADEQVPAQAPKQASMSEPARPTAPTIRTAYSAPQAGGNGLLAGAQPVLQAGSFDSRWAGLR